MPAKFLPPIPSTNNAAIGIRGLAAALPATSQSLEQLAASGHLLSTPATLAKLWFERAHIAQPPEDASSLAFAAAKAALADSALQPSEIDVLIWASALPDNHVNGGAYPDAFLASFNSSASRLQEELGLDRASVHGIAQQGCGGMFAALRTAHALLIAEPALNHVLCLGVDVLPANAPREILYNVISDAAAAVVVSREGAAFLWIDCHHVSKGYYWDVPARQKEIIASYFPTSRLVINELLARQNLTGNDIAHIIPTGVGADSWTILAQLCGLSADRIRRPAGQFGHTIAADNILHLAALRSTNLLRNGDRLLLFTYGFGSSWCGLLLEHVSK